jgi:hypothetical protein
MSSVSVEAFLKDMSDQRYDLFLIVAKLRDIVLAVGPAVTEEVKYGGILFSANAGFCGIFAYAAHVTIEFGQGAELPDPHQILAGAGKHRRHIKLLTVQEIEARHVAQYVALAHKAVTG